jgi:hypothetical protein
MQAADVPANPEMAHTPLQVPFCAADPGCMLCNARAVARRPTLRSTIGVIAAGELRGPTAACAARSGPLLAPAALGADAVVFTQWSNLCRAQISSCAGQ